MYFYAYIGVVGRTGAGKTTLFSAILRLTELESGQILIDDIDVSKVELKNLRSNIAGMFVTFTLKILTWDTVDDNAFDIMHSLLKFI